MPLSRFRRWLAGFALAMALPAVAADVELPPVDGSSCCPRRPPRRIASRCAGRSPGLPVPPSHLVGQADAAFTGAKLALPTGDKHRDEFFGDVETYRQSLTGVLTGAPGNGASSTTLTVKYRGCADAASAIRRKRAR